MLHLHCAGTPFRGSYQPDFLQNAANPGEISKT